MGQLGLDGGDKQQVPRLRKIIRVADDLSPLGMTGLFCGTTEVVFFPVAALPNPQRDGGRGIPYLATCGGGTAPAGAEARLLLGCVTRR